MNKKCLRLIGFDSGGVRSLSQLKILENITHRIQYDLYPDDPDRIVLPCECFDLICGSDMGGVIAIMLSKLRMTVEDAAEELYRICEEVYALGLSPEERTRKLRQCILDLLKRRGLPEDLKMGTDDRVEEGCPCFVVATQKDSLTNTLKIRTYRTRTSPTSKVTVVEAILATCAGQPAFLPVTIGAGLNRQEVVGGAMGAGNPCRDLISEAYDVFGGDAYVSTILSLGTGHLGSISVPENNSEDEWIEVLQDMVKNNEKTAQEMESQLGHLGLYYRFAVDQGLQKVYGMSANDATRVHSQSQAYLQQVEISRRIDHCVEDLRLRQGHATLEQLKYSGGGQPIYKGVPPLTSFFVMRQVPWTKMTTKLIGEGMDQEQRILVLSGLGGCGKTQLVIRFIKEYKEKFKFSFFIDGSSRESIQANIINHVRTASPAHSQASFSEALNFFCNPYNGPSLLIYDNVDDAKLDLTPLLPESGHGIIIVTTRNRLLGDIASFAEYHIELDVMSAEEAAEVILLSSRLERTEHAIQFTNIIASELGNLPVALTQAGSYIRQVACSCEEYLERLRRHRSEMMYIPAGDRLQRSAYAAFDTSYEQLPTGAQTLLHIIGFVHFADFPLQAIAAAAKTKFKYSPYSFEKDGKEFEESVAILMEAFCPTGDWDSYHLDKITRALQNYSLVSFTQSASFTLLRMHPLAYEWASDRLSSTKRQAFRLAASRLITSASSDEELQDYLMPHIITLLSRSTDLPPINDRAAFGHILTQMDRTKESRPIWEDIYNTYLNDPEDELLKATAGLDLAATREDDLDRMEELEKEMIEIRERLLGFDHQETLDAKLNLASTYLTQGNLEKSEELCRRCFETMKSKLGPDDEKVLEVGGWLAQIYTRQGHYSEAERLEEHILEVQKGQLGETHTVVLATMNNLAITYKRQGQFTKALLLEEKVFKIWKEKLGDTHTKTLLAMCVLATIYQEIHRDSEAATLLEYAFKVQRKRLGDVHPDSIVTMDALLLTYEAQERHSDALALLEEVIPVMKEKLGENNVETLNTMQALASIYYKLGRIAEAKALATQVERTEREILGTVDRPSYKKAVALLQQIKTAETDQDGPSVSAQSESSSHFGASENTDGPNV